MAIISPFAFFQALDNNADPLNGGKVYTYEAGTSTPKATYTDASGSVANSNPVILDSAGRADIWLGDGGYKFVLKNSADVTIRTVDNVGGTSSTAFGGDVQLLSTNTTINNTYANAALVCTASITLSLLAAADAGEGFYISVRNASAGNVTVDPDTSELIDGASTLTIRSGFSALVICTGTAWRTLFSFPNNSIGSSDLNSTAITGQTAASLALDDIIIFSDTSATGALKKCEARETLELTPLLTEDVVTAADSFAFSDSSDSGLMKRDTVQGILDLASPFTIDSRIAASGTDIEKTSITANAKRITILLDGLSASGTGAIQVILGDSGGYETSGYVGAASQSSASVATSNISSGFAIASTTTAASVYSGMIVLQKGAGNTWYCHGVLGRSDAAVTTYFGGYKTLSATLDRVKLNASGDTFDTGGVTYVVEV